MPTGQTPAPGWYTDTSGQRLQWWDGSRWTERFAPTTAGETYVAIDPAHRAAPVLGQPKRKGVDHANDTLVTFGVVTAILLPIIGAVCGIALMGRQDRRGGSILVLSTVMFFAWPIAIFMAAAVAGVAS